ncbi:glycoside hydrolase family 2 protein [Streptococcus plurextorum]|uniref:glycoside hydrolase family 2 protein n=1 Tax=Streptococcus plurextorum TaxID=456876 RepID=UPI00048568BA|nr:glycoside hydrolase family 2 TIM barrel-domain containing protein [Streptococcus plurextorum]
MERESLTRWEFIKGGDCLPENWLDSEIVTLPHTWNAVDGQDGGNDYFRGKGWYRHVVDTIDVPSNGQVYLEFLGVAMVAEIYVNGKYLAKHEGGYSTFRVAITEELSDQTEIIVKVSNEENAVYPQKADFTFYGGIYRQVHLLVVPECHFNLDYCGAPALKVTPVVIDLEDKTVEVTLESWIKHADQVTFKIGDQSVIVPVEKGKASTVMTLTDARLWDGIADPYLYLAEAVLENGERQTARFGCRQFEMDPQNGFMLNGRSYPLRGVSRHQDFKAMGNAISEEQHRLDMDLILEMGANTIRLAHYQHAQEFYDLCDEKGICVWAEIPYITMHMTEGRANTLSQMEELIVQNYNHASIICWGLSNEITAASIVNEDLLENHRLLNELCHTLDQTRPTTMANVFMLETDSPILTIPDINSYNLYFGWYLGELEETDQFFDHFHTTYPDRVIGFSEYGADANIAFQSNSPERGDYTESYQSLYHEHMLNMIEKRPWLWSTYVWNMFDFAADGRDEGGAHGLNQKGLVTFDRRVKKDAFYLYKSAWSKEPVLHICGSRYVDRTEEVTTIKIYSNLGSVALYKDGLLLGQQTSDRVFTFQVPIEAEHTLEARANQFTSSIVIRRVAEPNLDYVFNKQMRTVTNWFDGEIDETSFSIQDTLGELQSHPEAGRIVEQMMSQGASSRGDVAESVKDNPALKRMLGRQTLISLLKHADNVTEEQIRQLNRILQGIKK